MLTKALAVASVMTLTATIGPATAKPDAPDRATTGGQTLTTAAAKKRATWVPDRTRRDHRNPDHNAQGIWVWPRFRPGKLFIQVKGQTLRPSRKFNGVDLFLQTRGNRKPDYRVVFHLPRDGDGVTGLYIKRIRGWKGKKGHIVRCPKLSGKWRPRIDSVEIGIPRRCIKRRGTVRVNALAWNYTRYGPKGPKRGVYDAVPGPRKYSRWI